MKIVNNLTHSFMLMGLAFLLVPSRASQASQDPVSKKNEPVEAEQKASAQISDQAPGPDVQIRRQSETGRGKLAVAAKSKAVLRSRNRQQSQVQKAPQPSIALNKQVLQQTFKKLDIEIPIRVLLEERHAPHDVHWKLASQGGFLVFSPDTKQKTVYQAPTIQVTCDGGTFSINNKKQTSYHLFIIPLQGPVLFQKHIYDGVLALTMHDGSIYMVNHLDLEDYVLSVLPYESWPAWPDEVHKAFCVAFRSYGIAKVLESRAQHAKRGLTVPYDIKNTNAHQIYKGRAFTSRFIKIINDTRGLVLAHNGKPILAMFDICCGGVVPSLKKGIHFSKAPYLKRTYPCNFCKPYRFYTWSCDYSYTALEKALRYELPHKESIKDIKVTSIDDAGIVQELKIRVGNHWHTIMASKFKGCLKDIRSLCFKIQKNGRSIKITGKGHGHHMGLCQRGAYYMVKQGKWNYRNILKFYYPHTMFMKLQKIKY